jgi:hypothetical protein
MQGLLGGGEAVEEEVEEKRGWISPLKIDLILGVQVLYHLSVLKECITCSFDVIYVFSSVSAFANTVASSLCMFHICTCIVMGSCAVYCIKSCRYRPYL